MINLKNSNDKLSTLTTLSQEIDARNITLSILVNVLNAYLGVHSLSNVELQAVQEALNKEVNYVDTLGRTLATNLGITEEQPTAQVEQQVAETSTSDIEVKQPAVYPASSQSEVAEKTEKKSTKKAKATKE